VSPRSAPPAPAAPESPTTGLAALGVCVEGDRVLLLRRRREPYAGLWSLPGGKPEAGEGLAEACRRELGEELGVPASVDGLRLLVSETLLGAEGEAPADVAVAAGEPARPGQWVLAVFACRVPPGAVLPAEAAWFPAAALPEAGMIATDRRFISDALDPRPYAAFRRLAARLRAGQPVLLTYA